MLIEKEKHTQAGFFSLEEVGLHYQKDFPRNFEPPTNLVVVLAFKKKKKKH